MALVKYQEGQLAIRDEDQPFQQPVDKEKLKKLDEQKRKLDKIKIVQAQKEEVDLKLEQA